MAAIGTNINQAAELLKAGGLVGIPTETVYGLAANAFQEDAVVNIFKAKNRPAFDPLITHVASMEMLTTLVLEIPEDAHKLITKYWPGPLTVVLPKSARINNLITSGLASAAFRMPRHELLHQLLNVLDFPVVAPSANPFGYVSPTSAAHVNQQLGDKIDYILDGGECKIGLESTIISFITEQPTILRLGGLSVEDIEAEIGKVAVNTLSTSKPNSPGMFSSHYAPTKPVVLGEIEDLLEENDFRKIGILSFSKKYSDYPNFVLSQRASVEEAAKNLFTGLRWFENQDVEMIITENAPDKGLGKAINDRLNRASRSK